MDHKLEKQALNKTIGIFKMTEEELGIIALLRNLKPYDIMEIAVNQDASRWSVNITKKERTVFIINRQSRDTNSTP